MALRTLVPVGMALFAFACASTPLAEGWHRVDTRNVRLRTNVAPERAVEIASQLQETRDALAGNLLRCGFEDPEPIEVTILWSEHYELLAPKNAAAYRQAPLLFGQGWYAPQIVIPNDVGPAAREVFQHELAHQLVATCFPAAPRWLNEGLATFVQTARFEENTLTLGLPAFVVSEDASRVYATLFRDVHLAVVPSNALPTLSELLASDSATFLGNLEEDSIPAMRQRVGRYAAAWGLVHLLVLGAPDLKARFTRFLAALHRGDANARRAFASEFAGVDLQARLDRYLWSQDVPYLEIRHRLPAQAPPRLVPMHPAEAHLHWAWLWSFDDAESRAQAFAHASQAAEYAPNRALAHATRALVRVVEQDFGAASAELERGLAFEPTNELLLQGLLSVELERSAGQASTRLESIGARLRPVAGSAESLGALAYLELRRQNGKAALADSTRAIRLNPRSWSSLLAHAVVLRSLGRLPEAAANLELAINLLPDGAVAARRSLLESLAALRVQMARPANGP